MPRRRRESLGAKAKKYWGLVVAVFGVLGSVLVAVLYAGDLLHSDHPPLASRARVEQLAQSVQQTQRQLNTTNFGLLVVNRIYWQGQKDEAERALRLDSDNAVARGSLNQANLQLEVIDQQLHSAAKAGH